MAIQISRTHMIYGIAILFVVPITLITWASSATVQMPVYGKPYIGYTVFGFGVIITLLGMGELLFRGRGLPTTLSTTIRFADVGAYSAMPHPIYTGVCIAVWGMSMAVQSASGLWLITPMVVIASVATVYGFERPYLRKTFPASVKDSRLHLPSFYTLLLRRIESTINHWKEMELAGVRVVAHGIYAGLGAMVGLIIFVFIQPMTSAGMVLLLLLFSMVGAAAWGQFLGGRRVGLRIYGYHGALLGMLLAVFALPGINKTETLAALAVAVPFALAIGKVRCLIQGCCHGHVCTDKVGIHYHTPNSTAVRSGLSGLALHPTQLYSMAINLVIGVCMVVLWIAQSRAGNLVGIYFILTGCGQFVEEAYKGETDTSYLFGLPLGQWLATALVFCGGLITCLPSESIVASIGLPEFPALLMCLVSLPLIWFAMGVSIRNQPNDQ